MATKSTKKAGEKVKKVAKTRVLILRTKQLGVTHA